MNNEPIRMILAGANGHMGKMVKLSCASTSDVFIVAECHAHDDPHHVIKTHPAEIWLDFTVPPYGFHHAKLALQAGLLPVIGTSGLTEEQLDILEKMADELERGGVWVPNFSLASWSMAQAVRQISRDIHDVAIVETHGPHKKDSTSATAIQLAGIIAEVQRKPFQHIPIKSLRQPGTVAEQAVRFGSEGEILTITHQVTNRQAFLPGILLAIRQVQQLKGWHVGLDIFLQPSNEPFTLIE